VEVQIRLQKALRMLAATHTVYAEPAARLARTALARSEKALALEEEKLRIREIVAETLKIAE
jgi:hypothetical protein